MSSVPSPQPQAVRCGMDAVLCEVPVDPERVNVAALRGVSVPTPVAVSVAKDALRAANQYYDLFFTEADAVHDGRRATAAGDEPAVHSPSASASSSGSSHSCSSCASDTEEDEENDDGWAGADGEENAQRPPSCRNHHRHHHHHRRGEDGRPHERRDIAANVRSTNYHTFFPPSLTHRQRQRIVHRIIGKRKSRPFGQWPWHKAEQYRILHARTVAQHQLPLTPVAAMGSAGRNAANGLAAAATASGSSPLSFPQQHFHTGAGVAVDGSSAAVVAQERGSSPASVAPHHAMNKPSAFTGGYQVSPTAPAEQVAPFPTVTVRASAAAAPASGLAGQGLSHQHRYNDSGSAGGVGEIYRSILSAASQTKVAAHGGGAKKDGHSDPNVDIVTPNGAGAADFPFGLPILHGNAHNQATRDAAAVAAAVCEEGNCTSPVVIVPSSKGAAAQVHGAGTLSSLSDRSLDAPVEGSGPSAPLRLQQTGLSPEEVAGLGGGSGSAGNASIASAPVFGTRGAEGFPRSCPQESPLVTTDNLRFDQESAMYYTIPASRQGPEYFAQTAEDGTKTLAIVMVGLPARGKTFLAQKITRLLGWHGTKAKVQNIQVAWRRALLDWEESRRTVEAMRATYEVQRSNSLRGGGGSGGATANGGGDGSTPFSAQLAPNPDQRSCQPSQNGSSVGQKDSPILSSSAPRDNPENMLKDTQHDNTASSPPATPGQKKDQNSSGCATSAKEDSAKAPYLRTEHFEHLITDPTSIERRLYRQVLKAFARDCSLFFASGGEVVIINDDFVTEELREEVTQLFKPLAANFVFMEVMRDAELNKRFNACKVKDPMEYPKDRLNLREAKRDFDSRLALLERLYEPLADARTPEDDGAGAASDGDTSETEGQRAAASTAIFTDGSSSAIARSANVHPATAAACSKGQTDTPKRRRRPSREVRSYIKIRNSDMIETHGIHGYLASRIISYVMNLSQVKIQHPIYFVRHGESCYNLEDRIGGNPLLTSQGMRDAAALLEFMDSLKSHLEHIDRQQQHRQRLFQEEMQRRALERQRQQREEAQPGSDCGHPVEAGSSSSYPSKSSPQHSTPPSLLVGGGRGGRQSSSMPDSASFATASFGFPFFSQAGSLQPNSADGRPTTTGNDTNSSRCNGQDHTPSESAAQNGLGPLLSPHSNLDNSSANNLEIWTSQLRRTIQTAELSERLLNIKTLRWSSLNEIHAGICEDMTYAEVKAKYPLIEKFRKQSKYTFRYPDGESYQDLVVRLEPVIMELENADKVVVVVAHQAVLRCLLAYFGSTSAESSIRVEVPHRTVWRCTYDSKGIASLEELKLDNWAAGFAPRKWAEGRAGDSDAAREEEDNVQQQLASIVREPDGI